MEIELENKIEDIFAVKKKTKQTLTCVIQVSGLTSANSFKLQNISDF